jgi:hypothetical protein
MLTFGAFSKIVALAFSPAGRGFGPFPIERRFIIGWVVLVMVFRFHAAALRPPNGVLFFQAALGAASKPQNDFALSTD